MAPRIKPPKISTGKCTPAVIRARPIKRAKDIKIYPAFLCIKKIDKAKAEKNDAWPEGKAYPVSVKSEETCEKITKGLGV